MASCKVIRFTIGEYLYFKEVRMRVVTHLQLQNNLFQCPQLKLDSSCSPKAKDQWKYDQGHKQHLRYLGPGLFPCISTEDYKMPEKLILKSNQTLSPYSQFTDHTAQHDTSIIINRVRNCNLSRPYGVNTLPTKYLGSASVVIREMELRIAGFSRFKCTMTKLD